MRANPTRFSHLPELEVQHGLATCASAQAYLSISRSTLWRLERTGSLVPVRLGRTVRYRWSDLHRLAGEGGAV